jgi:hypothetical protein
MRHWTMLELCALSLAGDYRSLGKYLDEFESFSPASDVGTDVARRAFMLCMRSEVLRSEGRAESAERAAIEAQALMPGESSELFFFSEFMLHRQVEAALVAGRWAAAEEYLAR